MRKKYLAEKIGDDYLKWEGKKVLITATTGMGKTTFILDKFLPYCKKMRKKLLVLCNRRLLKQQYLNNLLERCYENSKTKEDIEIMTYQQLYEKIHFLRDIRGLFQDYYAVVCDEVHYFYLDSDFNGSGTYVLLQAIIYAGFPKTMLFMSATMEEVKPLICETIDKCYWKHRSENSESDWLLRGKNTIEYNYISDNEFDRIKCYCLPDIESIATELAISEGKSVVFIDNKDEAEEMKNVIIGIGGIQESEVCIFNADNLDSKENNEVIEFLTVTNKVKPKILITTSVLDNGVSIHDKYVKNIVIITDSKISFLQMIGRIRSESTDELKLFFVERNSKEFLNRIQKYEKELAFIKMLNADILENQLFKYVNLVWENPNSEEAVLCRKFMVLTKRNQEYYFSKKVHAYVGDIKLSINYFAKEKVTNMYETEKYLYLLSVKSNLNVVYHQMKWIGKMPEELICLESNYEIKKKEDMKEKLLLIKEYDKEKLKEFKMEFSELFFQELKRYFKDAGIKSRRESFSNEKLKKICLHLNLRFKDFGGNNGCKRYTVEEDVENE